MAQRTQIILEDDIDGGEADETVTFALDGTNYEIDLNSKNADYFRGLLQDHIAAGRKVGKATRNRTAKASTSGPSAAEIRAWAKENGHDVPDRGRIPQEVRDAFDAR